MYLEKLKEIYNKYKDYIQTDALMYLFFLLFILFLFIFFRD